MSRREHFDGGHNKPDHFFTVEDRGEDFGQGRFRMALRTPEHREAAAVTYDTYTEDNDDPTLDIDYLKSHVEGQGYAKKLMQNVYDTYPEHHINWGHTINPASTHLAEQFEDKYFDRTSYYTDDDF